MNIFRIPLLNAKHQLCKCKFRGNPPSISTFQRWTYCRLYWHGETKFPILVFQAGNSNTTHQSMRVAPGKVATKRPMVADSPNATKEEPKLIWVNSRLLMRWCTRWIVELKGTCPELVEKNISQA
jgi:hypothetical protein